MSDYFDKIITGAPINSQAAKTMGRGIQYEHKFKDGAPEHWKAPPKIRKAGPTTHEDLTGTEFGWFKVIGLHAERRGRWIVRCSCGDYEVRTPKAIKNPMNSNDKCRECRNIEFLKDLDYSLRHGVKKANEQRDRRLAEGRPKP